MTSKITMHLLCLASRRLLMTGAIELWLSVSNRLPGAPAQIDRLAEFSDDPQPPSSAVTDCPKRIYFAIIDSYATNCSIKQELRLRHENRTNPTYRV